MPEGLTTNTNQPSRLTNDQPSGHTNERPMPLRLGNDTTLAEQHNETPKPIEHGNQTNQSSKAVNESSTPTIDNEIAEPKLNDESQEPKPDDNSNPNHLNPSNPSQDDVDNDDDDEEEEDDESDDESEYEDEASNVEGDNVFSPMSEENDKEQFQTPNTKAIQAAPQGQKLFEKDDTPLIDAEAAKREEDKKRQIERIERLKARNRAMPNSIESWTKRMKVRHPKYSETHIGYLAHYYKKGHMTKKYIFTEPDEIDDVNTDDENTNDREIEEVLDAGGDIAKLELPKEYTLHRADRYKRLAYLDINFAHDCFEILGEKCYKKRRFTDICVILEGMFEDEMLEWFNISVILALIKQSRPLNINKIFKEALNSELTVVSQRNQLNAAHAHV